MENIRAAIANDNGKGKKHVVYRLTLLLYGMLTMESTIEGEEEDNDDDAFYFFHFFSIQSIYHSFYLDCM